jgi:hypothetical protein
MSLMTVGGSVLRAGAAAWRRGANRRHLHRAAELVPGVLSQIGDTARSWVAGPVVVSSTRTAVVPLGPPGRPPVAMAKFPGTPGGVRSQQREGRMLGGLAAEPAVGDFTRFLPLRLTDGYVGGQPFVVERAMPGIAADIVGESAAVGAASAIAVLHARTARPAVVDDALLRRWVDNRIDILARSTRRRDAVERLRWRLHAAWAGRHVEIGWVHGDFWPGNVIVDPATGAAAGIIDWEWAGADELPAQDLVYACVHTRIRAGGAELGDVVAGLLASPRWGAAERELLHAARAPVDPVVDPDVLLLVWLRQIAANLLQSPGLARNPLWVLPNVISVLRAIDTTTSHGRGKVVR